MDEFILALNAHQHMRFDEAERLYHQMLAKNPGHFDSLHNLGILATQRGQMDIAEMRFVEAANANAQELSLWINWLEVLIHSQKWSTIPPLLSDMKLRQVKDEIRVKAEAYFEDRISSILAVESAKTSPREPTTKFDLRPPLAEMCFQLGFSFHQERRFVDAEKRYRNSLELFPTDSIAIMNLAETLRQMGRMEEAILCCHQAILLDSENYLAFINLGDYLILAGKNEEAEDSYRQAIRLGKACNIDPVYLAIAESGLNTALNRMVPYWHIGMMNDLPRNEAYFNALRAAITPDSRVLEIGTGSGLLAMMAAQCGAKSVHTCEVVPRIAATAKQIIENNGLSKRIHVIAKQSSALEVGREIPERANVLVSEIFSSEFVGEGVFESIDDAKKRLLTPDAKIIPMGGSIMIALFAGEEIRQLFRVGQMMGFDLSHFNSTFPSKTSNFRNDLRTEFLTSEIEAFQFHFCKPNTVTPESKKIELIVTKSGLCEGIIQWLRLQMDEVSVFENHPHTPSTSSSWQHTIFRLPTPTFLEAGQKVTILASHNRQIVWVSLT